MQKIITNCIIYSGDKILKDHAIVIENGVIQSVSIRTETPQSEELVDLQGLNISAGFIDMHINGGEQFHFTQSPTEEAINDIYESSLKYGTTEVMPCLITSSHQNILQGIEAIKKAKSVTQLNIALF